MIKFAWEGGGRFGGHFLPFRQTTRQGTVLSSMARTPVQEWYRDLYHTRPADDAYREAEEQGRDKPFRCQVWALSEKIQ